MSEEQCNRCGNMAHFVAGGNPEVNESAESSCSTPTAYPRFKRGLNDKVRLLIKGRDEFGEEEIVDHYISRESAVRLKNELNALV